MKKLKEWFIDAPWGKIALVSWGNPSGEPVLMVHGRQDSAATFIPLLEYLPESFHYVGVDLPGHGWSDPMPTGVMLTRFHFLAAVEYAVRHLGWDQFLLVGHSMGCEQGLFYNVVNPGKIKEFILLDPIPSLQRLLIQNHEQYYRMFYAEYYRNYEKYNRDDRVYTKREAVDAVRRNRGLSEEQAEVVLSRNLWPVGDDQYRLSWDRRLKYPATKNYPPQYYYELFTLSTPPTLVLHASDTPVVDAKRTKAAEELVEKIRAQTKEFKVETVKGAHDVHITHPKMVAERIVAFLSRNGRSKL